MFLSSIVYFFAMNFDRLYFAKQISLSQLGVYGDRASLADMVSLFVARAGSSVLYPSVAAAGLAPVELEESCCAAAGRCSSAPQSGSARSSRSSELLFGSSMIPATSEAGWILPILCVGVWFGMLTSTNDSILMGLARPAYPALSNAAKLITYVVGVPLAFCLLRISRPRSRSSALGEIVKYVALWLLSHKEHLQVRARRSRFDARLRRDCLGVGELTRMLGVGGGLQAIYPHLVGGMAGLVTSGDNGGRPDQIAVAICTYKRNDLLTRLLDALLMCAERVQQPCRVGVVIVDDTKEGQARPVAEAFADRFELGAPISDLGPAEHFAGAESGGRNRNGDGRLDGDDRRRLRAAAAMARSAAGSAASGPEPTQSPAAWSAAFPEDLRDGSPSSPFWSLASRSGPTSAGWKRPQRSIRLISSAG